MPTQPKSQSRTMFSRRRLLLGGAATVAGASGVGLYCYKPAPIPPRKGQLTELDRKSYIHNMTLHRQHFAGKLRPGKLQMMAVGERRYLFQLVFNADWFNPLSAHGQIIDVTDPMSPVVVNESAFKAFNIQLAYRAATEQWILMISHEAIDAVPPWMFPGLRGVSFVDVTDPANPKTLSKFSTDGGDPGRILQSGSGCHRCYWDGGKYAYLTAAPDKEFYDPSHQNPWGRFKHSMQIIDVSDLSQPRLVSRWWVPGQRNAEDDARRGWRSLNDPQSFNSLHGPVYVPTPVEKGGVYGYGGWGTHGVLIHDLSDPSRPRLVGRWDTPNYLPGPMIPHHTVDVTRLNRGFVISNPESIEMDCDEPWHDSWIIDVSDPAHPKALAPLPRPEPPLAAPYRDFCQKRGRYGPHNAPHLKAPGVPHPNFTAYTYFNGGLQCYDLKDPKAPALCGYYVPPQNGSIDDWRTYERSADDVFIEWDRRLIWLASNSGLHLLSSPALGEPVLGAMKVSQWSLPGLNTGAA